MDRGDVVMLLVVSLAVVFCLFVLSHHSASIRELEQRVDRCEGGE